ncbi:hypothetical protein IFM89_008828 [Coptis chinensis]|uniref:SANTA domain-containing protein n=1 Tax=Coptis chinensis TaxID=261450 RepID=A0A835LKX8_9MAGN|nr:hypothetical protein IFM89_008828 [Coptis chinensis]
MATPKKQSSFKKAVVLKEWWLVKSGNELNGQRLAIGGIESVGGATRSFRSAPIVKRYSMYEVESADGIPVFINGYINRPRTEENGVSLELCDHFLIGFPPQWKDYSYHCGEGLWNKGVNHKDGNYKGNSFEEKLHDISKDSFSPMRETTNFGNSETREKTSLTSSPCMSSAKELEHLSKTFNAIFSSKRKRTEKSSFPQSSLMATTSTSRMGYKNSEKNVYLLEWWLLKAETDFNGKILAVGGFTYCGENEGTQIFSSKPIVKRTDTWTLQAADDMTIYITGSINKTRSSENGFSFEVCNRFDIGFPYDWQNFSNSEKESSDRGNGEIGGAESSAPISVKIRGRSRKI